MFKYQFFMLLLFVVSLFNFTPVSAKESTLIKTISASNIEPSSIEKYGKKNSHKKPLLILLSSTDSSCPPCLPSNSAYLKIAQALKAEYSFATVVFNPYGKASSINAYHGKAGVMGYPWVVLYHKGKLVGSQSGQSDMMRVDTFRKAAKKFK